jgi:hypothetical protein
MKFETDFDLLKDDKAKQHPAWTSFLEEMRGRDYDWGTLSDAWEWFKAGWVRADERSKP